MLFTIIMPMTRELVCPSCRQYLQPAADKLFCRQCNISYPIIDDIPSFISDAILPTTFSFEISVFFEKVERRHFWHVSRRELIHMIIRDLLKDRNNSGSMIELGCGNGSVARYLEEKKISVEGGDGSLDCLRMCRQKTKMALYHIDCNRTPFPDETYDVVGAFDLLEHLENEDVALKEINRVCKKGGLAIITVPAKKCLWSNFDIFFGHKKRYEKEELAKAVTAAGFTIKRITYFMAIIFPIIWAMRCFFGRKRYRKEEFWSNFQLTKTIPVLNEVILCITAIEKILLKKANLPFGASLICVAQK